MRAGLVLGSAALRALMRRMSNRAREAQAGVSSVGELASVSVTHFVSGAVVLAMSLGAQTAPMTAVNGTAARAVTPQASSMVAKGKEPAARIERSDRSRDVAPATAVEGGEQRSTDGDRARSGGSSGDLLGRMTAGDVEEPEDAHITSIAMSPRVAEDQTMLAAGRGDCPSTACPAVLFESRDAGRSWTRLGATGFEGGSLMLTPAFGKGDDRIFAMGRAGLQVSVDGGATFTQASPTGANYVVGAAAMSPAFNEGDPSILIGTQTLMRYRDDVGVLEPTTWTTGAGPLYPAYSPQYPADGRILVGGLHPAPDGTLSSAVHVCSGTSCSATLLGRLSIRPQVRPAPDFATSNLAYAFADEMVFVSGDGGASFSKTVPAWGDAYVRDLAVGSTGRVFAAVEVNGTGGVYYSDDRGATWVRVDNPLFEKGATSVTVSAGRVVASLGGAGLACSSDGGATWAARCEA
jgi:hypothetical protein